MPVGSLGWEVAHFLDQNGFEPLNSGDWIQRTHDVWHVLTGLSPSTEDELMLQAFTRAQLFRPSCAIIVLLGLISHRCSWRDIFTAVKYGKQARRIVGWDVESDWATPLDEVRQKLGIVPLESQSQALPTAS
ncbi:MAG: Coq4 family protein [Cyanobacteriota bacterium]|nr:Coq4 family protein [Cyanobacteriota bacterium]